MIDFGKNSLNHHLRLFYIMIGQSEKCSLYARKIIQIRQQGCVSNEKQSA